MSQKTAKLEVAESQQEDPRSPELQPVQNPNVERRESKRIPFYRGEFPEAKIEFAGRTYDAEVYDLSTNGIGILPKQAIPGLDTISQKFFVTVAGTSPREATLRNISHIKFAGSFRLKLGVRTADLASPKVCEESLLPCTENMPLAYCDDPIAFSRTLLFNVSHFSKNGLVLRTKNLHGVFFSGLKMDLKLMMPARGEFEAVAEVAAIREDGDVVLLYCTWSHCPNDLKNSVSEFLLMTVQGMSIQRLRDYGFLVADLEKAFLFKSAQTPEEFESILKLRLKAAKVEGRWLDTEDFTLMRDPWDRHSRQVYCEVNGRIVSAARVVFNNGLPERSEHVSYGVEIPEWLWKEGFVEGSRVCTDPDFRGTDVFFKMLQQLSHIVTQSGHRFAVMNCVDGLVPVYKKMLGVEALDQRFHTRFMQEDALNLLYIDFRALQVGVNRKVQTWAVNAPIGDHVIEQGQLKLFWWEKLIRAAFRPLHGVVSMIVVRRRYKKATEAIETKD
ncbi:MAG: hypothetical protein KDD51_07695 [Bdellovibrionales bacterium]|nr:hypothetical protein [Bdellovibrionales bacterium]